VRLGDATWNGIAPALRGGAPVLTVCAVWIVACSPATGPTVPGPGAQASSSQAVQAPQVQAQTASTDLPPGAAAPDTAKPSLSAAAPEIDALIAEAIAAARLPGCVIAVGHGGGTRFLRSYGQRALVPQREPMSDDTIFDIASLTKPVIASAVLRLVDDGKIRLDERAARYVPALDRRETRAITVRQLLLHSAGLPHVNPLHHYDRGPTAGLTAALAVTPDAPPGTRFLYSDIGYLWLGQVAERAAGEALDAYLRRTIFEPLGMTETGFRPPASSIARIAPTELTDLRGPSPVMIRGVVHDPRAYRLGGVGGPTRQC
jgi:CubicO group peptidase (beta-lactamase class C family)